MQETVTVMLSTTGDEPVSGVEVPRRIGHVKLGDLLGEGTSGVVYAGYDELLARRVAVKLLRPTAEQLRRDGGHGLVDGVRAAAGIKHPNIVGVHSVEIVNGIPVIVMEFVDGVSLRGLLQKGGPLDAPLTLYVMRMIAAGIDALHAAQVVHRDIKPANVLFDREGAVHVCDFGLACETAGPGQTAGADRVAGSPLYMAPEAFTGVVSPQSDVYSLGVMLFEMLAARPPFEADSMHQMRQEHETRPAPMEWLREKHTAEPLVEVCERALHKQRIMRYKTAGHFLRALLDAAPPMNDAAHRQKIAELVCAGGAAPRQAAGDAPAATTFDLISRRAKEKRDSKSH
ncbi:Serine/threonine-protein kinase PrkC [Phycisphaerae bacterium RAS1]|nr:Serine/threonine-protein kinase PrkC [Phycisphaerae bacterium RAS1]